MAMNHSELELKSLGDKDLAKIISGVRDVFKSRHPELQDIAFPQSIASSISETSSRAVNRLVASQEAAIGDFFGEDIQLEAPSQLFFDTLETAEDMGLQLHPIFFPHVELEETEDLPGWKAKPESWYWERIKDGSLSEDASILGGFWGLLDTSTRPSYKDGKQEFTNDALGPILSELRNRGAIRVPEGYSHVPITSRFAISADEWDQAVFPELAKRLGLEEKEGVTVRMPSEMEFNYAGNLAYPHFGQANTWEWLQDKFGDGFRLVGGSSGGGGLSLVDDRYSGLHSVIVAARPLVVFSPNA